MKNYKQILEAIHRGILLALDDYEEDFGNSINPLKDSIKNGIPMKDLIWINENFIDLGLPSGTLWAKCNLGANTPKDFGNYYAWGEVEPKKEMCVSQHYKFLKNFNITKYNRIDDLGELLLEDDAAYYIDHRMRMPTKKLFEELLEYTKHQWIKMDNVYGMMFVGRNGNEMFIPAAGFIHEKLGLEGTEGNIWSSTRFKANDSDRSAIYLYISEKHPGEIVTYDKFDGFSIRPVLNKQ